MRQILLSLVFFLFLIPQAKSTHIVGGEITYRCLGNNQYEITLTVYRDCYNGVPWFDNPARVAIYDNDWSLIESLNLPLVGGSDTIPVELTNPCLTVPPDVCVHRQSYTRIIDLPFSPGGYTIVYQRCCRNMLIRNIPDPLNTGISIIAEIGEDALLECNNGAVFNNWPPVAICVHQPIDFDHSASDPDGDSLVYRLCTPLNGPDSLNPAPNPPFPGPYLEVEWKDPPYNLGNVLGGDPLTIDPHTGVMTGVPNTIGNFVVGVCVDEYRDGEVISTTRRDFQYNVADCGEPTAAYFAPEIICDTLAVRFINQSSDATFMRWYFDWPNLTPTTTSFSPIHTFPDTGSYMVALIANPNDPCSDTMIQEIVLTQTFIEAGLETSFQDCDSSGLTVQALDLSVDSIFGLGAWMWTLTAPDGSTQSSEEHMPQFVVEYEGDYQLQLIASGANGCPDTALVDFFAAIPNLDGLQAEYNICYGDSIFLYPDAPEQYMYSWSPAVSLSDPTAGNPLAFPLDSTLYQVTVSSDLCDRMGMVQVNLVDFGDLAATATPDRIYAGETTQLQALFDGASSFFWEPSDLVSDPNAQAPTSMPPVTTTYTVTAQLSSGCSNSTSVTVLVLSPECDDPYIFFPTAFTPNGDGENDELKLEGRFAEEVYWVIYSRWGEKVFEAFSLDDRWDGTFNGKEMPTETYGYYLKVRCVDGHELVKKGNVSLLR
ncbi:MAG: gliding motility-associated C-terminal domain-containing protein [Saprospiraceae bacterium]